jgi:hypothetical protein
MVTTVMRRLSCLLIAVAALTATAAPAPAAKPAPRAPQGWLGVMADGPMIRYQGAPRGEWGRMARAGAQTVRAAFYWDDAETFGPGAYNWRRTDTLVRQTARRRMRILPVVVRTPVWARVNGNDYASPPRDPALYAGFVEQLVRRYGPRGAFWRANPKLPRMPIRAWQIWNEPDQRFYWRPDQWAPSYVELLRQAAASIRRLDPGARVVLAGLTNRSWDALREVYAAGGRGHFDAVALHPYTATPQNVVRVLEFGRQVMDQYGDRRLPVWATEISFPAINPKRVSAHPAFKTTRRGQARLLYATMRQLARNRKRLKVGRAIWYTWLSRYRSAEWPDYSGLRRATGAHSAVNMPSLRRYRQIAREVQRRR